MRTIAFVSDLAVHRLRENYRGILHAIIDPVLEQLPEGIFTDKPLRGALNVRFFTITLDGKYDVFVGHGLADKNYSHYHNIVDFSAIFCSGTTWHAKYLEEGAPPDKLWITGFPKLDPLFNGTITRGDGPRILWAPTHSTAWPRQYAQVRRAVERLPFRVAHSKHPKHSASATLQPYADADVVIADGGSSLYEAWALGKPVVFPTWLVRDAKGLLRPESLERYIYDQRIGYHATSFEHFIELIEQAQAEGITEAEREFAEGILPTNLRGTSAVAYADALREIANS